MKSTQYIMCVAVVGISAFVCQAADVVPTNIQQPGSQPGSVGNLESPDKCDNCHGGYDQPVEPAFNWRGSAMGNAGRDPIFWATVAIAEQDFDGSGDLCIRCHSTGGWYGNRSTPTDGSGLAAGDDDGVDCDTCHKITNPDDSEHLGNQTDPFVANDGTEGYYGSGMLSLWSGSEKLGPYLDASARHKMMQSSFHRSRDFCGSCHDVSNPAVGNLAPNNGSQATAPAVIADGDPSVDGSVTSKAAFNNPPYAYGIVERTFSEFKASAFATDDFPVSAFPSLPNDLKSEGGALQVAYEKSLAAGTGGNYEDGTTRYFSCQTCHMSPVTGKGCNKRGAVTRSDLPHHDLTGGNYWVGELIKYQDSRNLLRLGGGLSALQTSAIDDGMVRAGLQLQSAAALELTGNDLRIINLTGHKLISGYPEGRRMWLRTTWYDANDQVLRTDGAYGPLVDDGGQPVMVTNPATAQPVQVESILDLNDPNTVIFEAHYAMTQEWANTLLSLGYPTDLALAYDRYSGSVTASLVDLGAGNVSHGTYQETFHFVINNHVSFDNRIPPYGYSYDEAQKRNALPVPADQYGNPGAGGHYEYWKNVTLNPPGGAVYADIELLYQGTSWEYVQFLYLANDGQNAFLGQEGINFLDAWINTGMVPPYVMATTSWGEPTVCTPTEPTETSCSDGIDNDCDGFIDFDDPDCEPACVPEPEICDDGIDNDCDGFIDGDDDDCATGCVPTSSKEKGRKCSDGIDNDCDGLIDGADPDC